MKPIITRSISGAVYVALIITTLLLKDHLYFSLLMAVFAGIAVWELDHITAPANTYFGDTLTVVDVAVAIASVAAVGLFFTTFTAALLLLFGLLFYPVVRLTAALYLKQHNAFQGAATSMLSLLYIVLPLIMLCFVAFDNCSKVILASFIMIWLNDTGAFLVGSAIGKHKLWERLSPKKSWEGFFGGFAFAVIGAVVAGYILHGNMLMWGIYGAVVSVLSTYGDLFESLIKRSFGVKDSGRIIPGHGGILDRIDSLLFVAPACFFFCLCNPL